MSPAYAAIRAALDMFDIEKARDLIRAEMANPSAELYYLASLVALNDEQRRMFLTKALELDPFHAAAFAAMHPPAAPAPAPVAPPPAPAPVAYAPPPPPVAPAAPAGPVAPPEPGVPVRFVHDLRQLFYNLDYRPPQTAISENYDAVLPNVGIPPINRRDEGPIFHGLINGRYGSRAHVVRYTINRKTYELKKGEFLLTNRRFMLFQTSGFNNRTVDSAIAWSWGDFFVAEVSEHREGLMTFTDYRLIGDHYDVMLSMLFQSSRALLATANQFLSAYNSRNDGRYRNILKYADLRAQEEASQNYIAAHLSRVNNIRQAFGQLLNVLVQNI